MKLESETVRMNKCLADGRFKNLKSKVEEMESTVRESRDFASRNALSADNATPTKEPVQISAAVDLGPLE